MRRNDEIHGLAGTRAVLSEVLADGGTLGVAIGKVIYAKCLAVSKHTSRLNNLVRLLLHVIKYGPALPRCLKRDHISRAGLHVDRLFTVATGGKKEYQYG